MNPTLADELTTINAIYGPNTLTPAPTPNSTGTGSSSTTYTLHPPSSLTTLLISFPPTYPATPPTILGPASASAAAPKGSAHDLAAAAASILSRVFRPSEPCVFDLLEELLALQSTPASASPLREASPAPPQEEEEEKEEEQEEAPAWTLSDPVTLKHSTFLARACPAVSVPAARGAIRHLLASDKRVARATHNITAWRIRGGAVGSSAGAAGGPAGASGDGVVYQDCDDDGESAAGGRLLHLLQLMDAWDVVVVVSRWFGGVHLGPDRFRLINQVAREAVVRGGFVVGKGGGGAG